jgi:multidrug efflux pump subunit AcrA (membrane-fusion protein)
VPVVPRFAIAQRAGRDVVFVLDGQRAVRREVVLGLGDDDKVEVREGVKAGERIIIHGLETLTDGTRVRVASSS